MLVRESAGTRMADSRDASGAGAEGEAGMLNSAAEAQLASAWSRDGRRDGGKRARRGLHNFFTDEIAEIAALRPLVSFSKEGSVKTESLRSSLFSPEYFGLVRD